jgi:hypothetical protein
MKDTDAIKAELNKLSTVELFDCFMTNNKIRELLAWNIETVREHITKIMNNQVHVSELLKNNAGNTKYVKKRTNGIMNNNVENCLELYRYFRLLGEISKYINDKNINLVAGSVNLSVVLHNVIENCNQVLEKNRLFINEEIEQDINILVNKDRLTAVLMCIMQLTFAKYPNAKQLNIALKKLNTEEIVLVVAPSDMLRLESQVSDNEVFICEILLGFFSETYKTKFFYKNEDSIEHFYMKFSQTEVDPKHIELTVASTNPLLDKLLESDLFSIYHTSLSKVLKENYFYDE